METGVVMVMRRCMPDRMTKQEVDGLVSKQTRESPLLSAIVALRCRDDQSSFGTKHWKILINTATEQSLFIAGTLSGYRLQMLQLVAEDSGR